MDCDHILTCLNPNHRKFFYIFAFSLWATKGLLLVRILEVGTCIGVPILMIIGMRKEGLYSMMSAGLFGALLGFLAFDCSGGLQSEIFGLLSATGYVITLKGTDRPYLRALLMLGACMVREPYLLGLLGAALILAGTPYDIWRMFLVPFFYACAGGFLILLLSGNLQGFFVYLPAMLFYRDAGPGFDPLLRRIFWIHRVLSSVTTFGVIPIFGYSVAVMWLWMEKRWRVACTLFGVFCIQYALRHLRTTSILYTWAKARTD